MEQNTPKQKLSKPKLAEPCIDDASIPLHAHAAYFWENEKEFAEAVGFLEAGLRRDDCCVIFGHEEANRAVCEILRTRGADVGGLQTQRRLIVLGGNSSGDTILSTVAATFEQALAGGAPLIRLLGNIGWGKDNWPGDRDLLAFESKVTEAIKQFPCIVVCMYDLRASSGLIAHHGGFETHPFIACDAKFVKNPYHVPTDIFLGHLETIATGISERRRAEETVLAITEGTAPVSGSDFFRSLVRHLAQALRVRYAFIAECTDSAKTHVRTLAFWKGEEFGEDIGFLLRGTPCDKVIAGEVCCYPKSLQSLFPEDTALVDLHAESYLGAPLHGSSGEILGHLVVMDDKPMSDMQRHVPILRIFAARAGVELERKRAEEALRKSEERLRALLDINNAIITKLTRDQLFHAICEALRRVVSFDRVALTLYEPESDIMRLVAFEGPFRSKHFSVGLALDPRDSHVGWAFLNQRPLLRRDLEIEQQFSAERRAFADGIRSMCALPLIVRGKSIGAVNVASLKRFQYSEADAEFLQEVANQIAIAIDNMQSYEEIKALNATIGATAERRRTLLHINNAVIGKLTRDELFLAICDALSRVVSFDRIALSLYEPDSGVLRIVSYVGPYRSDYSPIGRALDLKDSPVGQAFLQQKPILRRDLETERQTSSDERAFGHGFRSLCALPLIVRGKSIGAITVGSLTRFQYTEADAEFLMEVANQIALAIDNMQSYDDLRRLSAELGALLDVNRAIGRHLERDTLFGALASCLQGLLPTDRFGIELPLGDDKLQGHLLTPRGGLPQPTELQVMPAAGTACNWVLQNRQWIVTASRDELRERFPATFQVMSREDMESLFAMPLLTGESCRGVLFCMAASKGAYGDLPRALLEKVAVAVGVALDDCFAHEEVRRLRDRLEAENVYLQEEIKTEYNFEEIIGQSAPIRQLLRKVEQVAPTETSVLIQGETGTGKELLARAIHDLSPRREHPLVKVNCGAIPTGLVESELFGHEKGAFTGALQQRAGRFELADGGTIFLDEVGELPLDTQAKLLRVLQEGEFERVGTSKAIKVNVRVIAATNRNLRDAVKSGLFRSDLFYRLNVFPMTAPPLRERPSDIPLLIAFFLSKYAKRLGKDIQGVSKDTMDRLTKYPWPGNIRELQNLIERAVVVAEGPIIRIDDALLGLETGPASQSLQALEDVERAHIIRALMETDWVIHGSRGAASILGINPSTLRSRMQKLGINKTRRSPG